MNPMPNHAAAIENLARYGAGRWQAPTPAHMVARLLQYWRQMPQGLQVGCTAFAMALSSLALSMLILTIGMD